MGNPCPICNGPTTIVEECEVCSREIGEILYSTNWESVAEGSLPPSGRKVFAYYKNKLGNGRMVMAQYLSEDFLECSCEYECNCRYDDRLDEYYYPEGWYEMVENWEEWGFIPINEGEVTHWKYLPKGPE